MTPTTEEIASGLDALVAWSARYARLYVRLLNATEGMTARESLEMGIRWAATMAGQHKRMLGW